MGSEVPIPRSELPIRPTGGFEARLLRMRFPVPNELVRHRTDVVERPKDGSRRNERDDHGPHRGSVPTPHEHREG